MATKYFALYADGSNSKWTTLEEVLSMSNYLTIIKAQPENYHTTNAGNSYTYYRYIAIDIVGNKRNVQIDSTICTDFGVEDRIWGWDCNLYAKIVDKHGNTYSLQDQTTAGEQMGKFRAIISHIKTIDKFANLPISRMNDVTAFTQKYGTYLKKKMEIFWTESTSLRK